MNKVMSKEIMKRSKLRNKHNKIPTDKNHTAYKKQKNLCVKLSRKNKKDNFSNLDINKNKRFWESVKPLFSDKQKVRQKINLIEDENIISSDKEIAEKLNNFFVNAVSNLNIVGSFFR